MKRVIGFSLVELMVAMVLGLLVIGGALGVFIANQTTSRTNIVLSELQNTARLSHQLIAHDIRNAGLTGCNNSPRVSSVIAVAGARPAWADWDAGGGIFGISAPVAAINGRNVAAGTEAIRLMYGGGVSNTVSNYNGAAFTLNGAPVVPAGSIAIACDEHSASIFQVNQVVGNQITHGVAGLNCDANLGYVFVNDWACGVAPARTFTNNAMLMRFESVVWFVAASLDDPNVNSLFRASLVGGQQVNEEVLFGVSDLRFNYLNGDTMTFQTAAAVNAANAWGRIIAVNVTLSLDNALLQGVNVPANARNINFLVSLRNRLR